MKLTCDQATTICDKSQYKEASFWEIVKLSIHLFLCKKCGLYAKQNSVMTKCYKKQRVHENNHKKCLCDKEKEIMEQELNIKI